MFKELAAAYERFTAEGKIPPVAYKPKDIKWIVELGGASPAVTGPFKRGDVRKVFAPDRGRQGKVSASNLKPYLLLDKAQYVLGVSPPGKQADTALAHHSFITLLDEAWQQTEDEEVKTILDFLRGPTLEGHSIEPNDIVALRVRPTGFPFERPRIQSFWANYLADELKTEYRTSCGVCGSLERILRLFPRELVILGQKCQVTSFNLPAFASFGRRQTENSPICFKCGTAVTDALDYLIREPAHCSVIVLRRVRPNGPLDPFRSQLAVYWLSRPVELQDQQTAITDDVFRTVLTESFRRDEDQRTPIVDLRQVENLVKVPWTPREASLNLATERFHLAVLSANKGRLAVREWFSVSLADLRGRLRDFLAALRLISFDGDEPRARSIGAIVEALDSNDPNMTRGLLRTAYLGYPPSSSLLLPAVRRITVLWLKGKQDRPDDERERVRHIESLTSAIKMTMFYGKEDESMDQLSTARRTAPYLSGRLLAVLEQAQQRAHWVRSQQDLNRTIVDRFYGAASTAPCSVFGNLIRQATTAHLPDAGEINVLMEDVMRDIDEVGGFPTTLTAQEQAEFALGFYHQRADFRAKRKHQQPVGEPE